jgi:hypothetical protein
MQSILPIIPENLIASLIESNQEVSAKVGYLK